VQDPSGAIVPGAHVDLKRRDGATIASAVTDSAGQFHLTQPPSGEYRIDIALPGFQPLTRPLHIDKSLPANLTLTLALANVDTTVVVTADSSIEMAAPESNQDAASISADDMKSLPIFDDDVVATMSALLDAGVAGESGTTLIVDGVEMKTVGVSTSAIDRVSINQDPYSAQYRTPGRGQIEITTKSTSDKFHGSVVFIFRDAAFNASNYFATSKPPEQRRIYDGYLTGPIKPLHNTAFLFSGERTEDDTYNQVDATGAPAGVLPVQNVFAPTRGTWLTMKVSHTFSNTNNAYVLYRFYDGSKTNQTVGGQTLATTGSINRNLDMDITFHDDLAVGANKFNQFSFLFERNIDTTTSSLQAPVIMVQGAFTGGGGQADVVNTEYNPNVSDVFSWTHKIQQFKFGVQVPNMGRRILEDKTNRLGTYTFAPIPVCVMGSTGLCSSTQAYTALQAYQSNIPTSFSIQQGQLRFLTYYVQPGAFFQDQIQATPRLTITPGVRYEWQNAFPNTKNAFQPRLSFAYVVDKKHALVVRVGSGVYVRRVGADVVQRLAQYNQPAEQSLLFNNTGQFPYVLPAVPNICYASGIENPCTTLTSQPPNRFIYEPNLKSPVQSYFGLTVERQITKGSTFTIGYGGYRGWHAVRSLDVNAPLNPFVSQVRPNPSYSQIMEMDSGGYQKSDSLNASFRGRIGNVFSGFVQYGLQHADSDTQWSEFNPQNPYNANADWSRADTDQRQKFALFGTFNPDKPLNLGIGFYANTPLPYTITTGLDSYDPGIFNARPAGVARNSVNGGGYQDIQLRWSYTFKLHPHQKEPGPAISTSIASFNTLNRANFTTYNGVLGSSTFMQPISANSPRRLQLTLGYSF
jgi:Carboxypeptidase regulatory-like domain/TonB dependent receptor